MKDIKITRSEALALGIAALLKEHKRLSKDYEKNKVKRIKTDLAIVYLEKLKRQRELFE